MTRNPGYTNRSACGDFRFDDMGLELVMDELYTTKDIARHLHVSLETVRQEIRSGRLGSFRTSGGDGPPQGRQVSGEPLRSGELLEPLSR